MQPRVSVLLPVYGGERFLPATIEALLSQTYEDFEIVAVNDCSPDRSREVLASYDDRRLRVIDNERNLGQTGSLQVAIQAARSDLVARQDQDDISLPKRFELQVLYLDEHPEVVAVGASYEVIDENGGIVPGTAAYYPGESSQEMAWRLLWTDRLVDPSVMFRRASALTAGGFDPRYRYAQDYDLWLRLCLAGVVSRLSEVLLQLRIHQSNASIRFSGEQERELVEILQKALARIGIEINEETAETLRRVVNDDHRSSPAEIRLAERMVQHSLKAFLSSTPMQLSARSSVSLAAAEMLVKIATRNLFQTPAASLSLLARSVALSPRVLHPTTMRLWWRMHEQSKLYRHYVTQSWAEVH